jgi:hypothetical protein
VAALILSLSKDEGGHAPQERATQVIKITAKDKFEIHRLKRSKLQLGGPH